MPCNVIVYENDKSETIVSSMEVTPVLGIIENDKVNEFAPVIQDKLHRAIDSL